LEFGITISCGVEAFAIFAEWAAAVSYLHVARLGRQHLLLTRGHVHEPQISFVGRNFIDYQQLLIIR
jgi:hypothetical protein